MAVTLTTLESNLQTKLNATSGTTDAQEFLLLSKSVEALNPSIAVQDVIDEGTTQVAAVTSSGTTQVAAVTSEGTTQVGLVQTEGATQVAAVQAAGSGYVTQADIDASVSALVDSAPATLDTLNELAAALGDDANFSTTVTNSIATKMPLAGGTFTGNVTIGDHTQLLVDDDLKFISPSSTVGIQDARIAWWNETEAGIMAMIAVDRTASTLAPADLVFYTTSSVDSTANNGEGDRTERLRVTNTGAAVTGDLSVSGNVSGSYTNLHPESTNVVANTSQTLDMNKPHLEIGMTGATAFSGINTALGKTSMVLLDTSASAHTPSWSSDIKWPDATEPTWADHRYWVISMTCLNGTTILAAASGYTV